MPGPGLYVPGKNGSVKRAPGSVKRDSSGKATAVKTASGWKTPQSGPTGPSSPAPSSSGSSSGRTSSRKRRRRQIQESIRKSTSRREKATSTDLEELAGKYGELAERVGKAAKSIVEDSPEKRLDRAELRIPKRTLESDLTSAVLDLAGRDNVRNGRVTEFRGRDVAGSPTVRQVTRAAESGKLRVGGSGKVTTPEVRGARKAVRKASKGLRRAKRKATPRITSSSLNADQERFAQLLVKKTKLSPQAVGAWLVAEQGGPPGDEYSRRGYYNFLNIGPHSTDPAFNDLESAVDATAKLINTSGYYQGIRDSIGQGPVAQGQAILDSPWGTVQIPLDSVATSPGNSKGLQKARRNLVEANARAAKVGVLTSAPAGGKKKPRIKLAYPLASKGELIGTPHQGTHTLGNWMSDNAVDIGIPIGTPVTAIRDSVVTRISGSAPNHAANPAGWTVYLKDADGEEYSYMHLDSYDVKVGDQLKAGQKFGKSGAANGVPHLHLGVLKGDPVAMLEGKATGGTAKKKGPYAGSRRLVSQLVGQPVWGDKEEGHSSTGDHDPSQPDAYAQDINQPAGNAAEGEPAYNQATVTRIARNLRKKGADIPADFQLGSNWEGNVEGYAVQLLTAPHGSGPHIHLGARWTGEELPAGTISGSGTSSLVSGGTSTAPASSAPFSTASDSKPKESAREVLADLGYIVTPTGVKRKGRSMFVKPEVDLAELEKKYA